MAIKNRWYIQDRVILTYIYDELTIPDSEQSAIEVTQMVRGTSHIVHNIVDLREVTRYPTRLHQLTPLTSCMKEPNHGWMLIVMRKNAVLNFLTNVVMLTLSESYQVFTNPDELLVQFPTIDRSLPQPLPPYILVRAGQSVKDQASSIHQEE